MDGTTRTWIGALMGLLLAGMVWISVALSGAAADGGSQAAAARAAPSATPTLWCPPATPEPFWVEPVDSPTDLFSQVVSVTLGNAEAISVTAESGVFTPTGSAQGYYLVPVSLLTNTVHHLEVFGAVQVITWPNGCVYGGYTLRTTRDRYGDPLEIVQRWGAGYLRCLPIVFNRTAGGASPVGEDAQVRR